MIILNTIRGKGKMSIEILLRLAPLLIAIIILCLIMLCKYVFGIGFEQSDGWAAFTCNALTFVLYFYIILLLCFLISHLPSLHEIAVTRISYIISGIVSLALIVSPSGSIFNLSVSDILKLPAMFTAITVENLVRSPEERAYDRRLTDREIYISAIKQGDLTTLKTVGLELIDGEFNQGVYSLVVHAAVEKRLDMVQLLVAKGASLDPFSQVLYYAATESNLEIVQFLVSQGAEPLVGESGENFLKDGFFSNFDNLPIARAAEVENWDIVEFLLQAANSKTTGRYADFVLLGAGDQGSIELAEIAFKHGAHANSKNSFGKNFLMFAIDGCCYSQNTDRNGQEKCLDAFFKIATDHQLDWANKNGNGYTVFDLAKEQGEVADSIAQKYRKHL
jgi:ankyrin repeat protein